MNIKGILFDLDGTVINTNDLVIKSFQHTLKNKLNLEVTRGELVPFFGEPLVDTFARYSADKVDLLVTAYREFNRQEHDNLTTIFPGVKETIIQLKNEGYLLAIVTSKKNASAHQGLRLFGLEQYFDCFVGYDDTEKHKPNPEPVFQALASLSLKPEQAIMVGDSPYDILCGKNAGTATAVVKYSEHPLEKLMEYKPDYVLNDLTDIFKHIKNRPD